MKEIIIKFLQEKGLLAEGCTKLTISQTDEKGNEHSPVEMVSAIEEFMRQNPLTQVMLDVREFCETAGQEVHDTPVEMSDSLKTLRMKLIQEEGKELQDACDINDEIEERDAIIDLVYVEAGYVLQRGIHSKANEDWNNIHASNMSKFCQTEQEAKDTVSKQKRSNIDCEYVVAPTGLFVVKSKDEVIGVGKVLKSHLYTPAKLKKI